MTFPVVIEPYDGQFAASLVGLPDLRAIAPTRQEALIALEAALKLRVDQGKLLALEVPRQSVSDLAGRFRGDPSLRKICKEAYQLRDSGT